MVFYWDCLVGVVFLRSVLGVYMSGHLSSLERGFLSQPKEGLFSG